MNKNKIMTLLGITEEDYNSLQFDLGMSYLGKICSAAVIRKELSYNELYWNWWKSQWNRIDEYFLEGMAVDRIDTKSQFYRLAYIHYVEIHRKPHLVTDRFVQDEIANDYNHMIREIIKNSINKEVL